MLASTYYAFPNDEAEQYRDDLKKLFISNFSKHSIGTGTGRCDVQETVLSDIMFQQLRICTQISILEMEMSPIQPDWVYENVSFVVDDVEHESD
ncbi:hypothetical protein E4U16_001604 [Claviceps sp. LM84 group G4]|nr:hypothetical protein E4U16_001604 [Claviceps sp. LM84 group G4]